MEEPSFPDWIMRVAKARISSAPARSASRRSASSRLSPARISRTTEPSCSAIRGRDSVISLPTRAKAGLGAECQGRQVDADGGRGHDREIEREQARGRAADPELQKDQ